MVLPSDRFNLIVCVIAAFYKFFGLEGVGRVVPISATIILYHGTNSIRPGFRQSKGFLGFDHSLFDGCSHTIDHPHVFATFKSEVQHLLNFLETPQEV